MKIGFLGGGNMAEAIVTGIIKRQLFNAEQIIVADINQERINYLSQAYQIKTILDNKQLVIESDIVVIAVKPQIIKAVLHEVPQGVWHDKLIISVAAGVELGAINELVGEKVAVARVMPNTPCLVGEGMSAISYNPMVSQEHINIVNNIFVSIGEACEVPEHLLNAVTGVSGSGPAYIFMIIEALIDGGVKIGLPRDISRKLAVQTLIGAATMVKNTSKHPGDLKDMVTSPGGTTMAALATLEERGLRSALITAVEVAANKAAQIGKQS